MTEYRPTTLQERMDLLRSLVDAPLDAAQEWAKRWDTDSGQVKLVWLTDGTVQIEQDYQPIMRIRYEVTATIVPLQYADRTVPLTWGQVPAGWEVLAPNGQWYAVERTWRTAGGTQAVIMLGKTWQRDPAGPVTARPGVPDATDVAIAALGYPDVLEDGR